MADTKYSALPATTAASSNVWGVAQTGTSWAVTQSSVALIPFNQVNFNDVSTPASTVATGLALYNFDFAQHQQLAMVDQYGLGEVQQPSLWNQDIWMWFPTSSSPGNAINGDVISIGTFSSSPVTIGTKYAGQQKGVYFTSSGTVNLNAGVSINQPKYYQGSTAGQGGYFFHCRFAIDQTATSTRYFVGMSATTAPVVCTSNPSTMVNMAGFGFDSGGSAFVMFHNDSTGTASSDPIASQPAFAAGNCYDAYIFAPPNTTRVYYRLDDYNAASTLVNSSFATELPNNTSIARAMAMCGNLSASSGAGRIGIIKMYVERAG